MVSSRVKAWGGPGLLVLGVFMAGEALHLSVVQGTYPMTDVAVVLRIGLGIILIAIGYNYSSIDYYGDKTSK